MALNSFPNVSENMPRLMDQTVLGLELGLDFQQISIHLAFPHIKIRLNPECLILFCPFKLLIFMYVDFRVPKKKGLLINH